MSNKAPTKEYKTEDGEYFTTVTIYDAINKGDEWPNCDITGLRRNKKTDEAEVFFEGYWYGSYSCGREVEKLLKKEEKSGK